MGKRQTLVRFSSARQLRNFSFTRCLSFMFVLASSVLLANEPVVSEESAVDMVSSPGVIAPPIPEIDVPSTNEPSISPTGDEPTADTQTIEVNRAPTSVNAPNPDSQGEQTATTAPSDTTSQQAVVTPGSGTPNQPSVATPSDSLQIPQSVDVPTVHVQGPQSVPVPAPTVELSRELAALDASPAKTTFLQNCAGCHGTQGKGDGRASQFLYPQPRNFTLNEFKLGSTPTEITATIARGIAGTSMPAFEHVLTAQQINDLVQLVYSLAGETSASQAAQVPEIKLPKAVGSLQSQTKKGKALYQKNCAFCHGKDGRGDGPSAATLVDSSGISIRPPDFIGGPLKGGDDELSIYRRIAGGAPGTPMPGYAETLSPAEVRNLAVYIRSIRKVSSAAPVVASIKVKSVTALPKGLDDTVWAAAPKTVLNVQPLWKRPSYPPLLTVRAVTDGKQLGVLAEWSDSAPDTNVGRVDDYLDALAMMAPTERGIIPFVGMGGGDESKDKENIVHIWHWKALGQIASPEARHPRTHRDNNPWEKTVIGTPAAVVGNPLTAQSSAPSENIPLSYVASGPGTLTPVTDGPKEMTATSQWKSGKWKTLFLSSKDLSTFSNLSAAKPLHVAFALWDGSQGDRNGQKCITQWTRLEVAKP